MKDRVGSSEFLEKMGACKWRICDSHVIAGSKRCLFSCRERDNGQDSQLSHYFGDDRRSRNAETPRLEADIADLLPYCFRGWRAVIVIASSSSPLPTQNSNAPIRLIGTGPFNADVINSPPFCA